MNDTMAETAQEDRLDIQRLYGGLPMYEANMKSDEAKALLPELAKNLLAAYIVICRLERTEGRE